MAMDERHAELLQDTRDVIERLFYEWLTENESQLDRLRFSTALTSAIMAYDGLRDIVYGSPINFESPDDYGGYIAGSSSNPE